MYMTDGTGVIAAHCFHIYFFAVYLTHIDKDNWIHDFCEKVTSLSRHVFTWISEEIDAVVRVDFSYRMEYC